MALGVAENATLQKESGSEPGGVPKLGVFSRSRPNLWDTVVAVWVCETIERKHFRTINVQWIGQWGLFSRCGSS
jgi:hypothetical protein